MTVRAACVDPTREIGVRGPAASCRAYPRRSLEASPIGSGSHRPPRHIRESSALSGSCFGGWERLPSSVVWLRQLMTDVILVER